MAPIETYAEIVGQGMPGIHNEGPEYLRVMGSQLITSGAWHG